MKRKSDSETDNLLTILNYFLKKNKFTKNVHNCVWWVVAADVYMLCQKPFTNKQIWQGVFDDLQIIVVWKRLCTLKLKVQIWEWLFLIRCTSIWTKLSYQFLDWSIVRHCPKGQLGQIWVNLGQNCGRAESRNFTQWFTVVKWKFCSFLQF